MLAPAAATAAALSLSAGPVQGAVVVEDVEFTYTDFDGRRITCGIGNDQSFDRRTDDAATAGTFVEGPPSCADSIVFVDVTYLLPNGRPATGGVAGFGEAFGFWEPVGSNFRSEHEVEFFDCDFEVSDCNFDTTLVQPK